MRTEIDLDAEIERVRTELVLFRDTILPAFFRSNGPGSWQSFASRDSHGPPYHPLEDWQRAATRLIEALPEGSTQGNLVVLDRAAFDPFMFQEAEASYSVQGGRIVWRIVLFMDWDMAADACLNWMEVQDEGDAGEVLRSDLPRLLRWLLSLSLDDTVLWNALCLVAPIIADADPEMLRRLLDPETYRRRVLADRSIGPEERERRLKEINGHFLRILNNALLHALAGLANNHFGEIPALLIHRALLVGGYTELMPHYLFGVQFEKVSTLHGFAREVTAPESA